MKTGKEEDDQPTPELLAQGLYNCVKRLGKVEEKVLELTGYMIEIAGKVDPSEGAAMSRHRTVGRQDLFEALKALEGCKDITASAHGILVELAQLHGCVYRWNPTLDRVEGRSGETEWGGVSKKDDTKAALVWRASIGVY